jgi:CDP-paratose 2-epimerase
MRFLVTGGCGFVGSNLGAEALRRGHDLCVADSFFRAGAEANLAWLQGQGSFAFRHADVRNAGDVDRVVGEARPDVVFHLAGQVAMTTSLADPRRDFETNAMGSFNVLDAVRRLAPDAVVVYSSTNKVYGDLAPVRLAEGETRFTCPDWPQGFDETLPLDFQSPYGVSKGAADQCMLDHARMFGLRTVVFRHSSIYGGRQFSTYDQGWIGWFVEQALRQKGGLPEPFTISGDGKQVRDVLFASDLVALYFAAVDRAEAARGQAFNIGGGMANSLSLLELFAFLERELDTRLSWTRLPWRQSDQRVFVADVGKAERLLGWRPAVSREEGLRKMIAWVRDRA